MSQYKVPQNVEAEDHILGPLTFKQFIYALIGVVWAALSFVIFKPLPAVMIIVGAPPLILFMLLAFYNRDGQNFEQLLIAMVGFFSQPRHRLWIKEDIIESFHIEPHKIVAEQTQRNPVEVRSELEKIATLIDSRGWNQRQPEADVMQVQPALQHNERIVSPPLTRAAIEQPRSDILDLQHSALAQNLNELIDEAAADVRQEAIAQMNARATTKPAVSTSVTTPASDDILKLATERDDLTVSQLAANANRIAPLPQGQSVEIRSNGN